jgi:hypothetical protein
MSFVKLDKGLLTSSLWIGGDAETVRTWVYLLLAADQDGMVYETLPAIAYGCKLPVERAAEILALFAGPDPHSRTPKAEGRRITIRREPQWSVEILNYLDYRLKDHTGAARAKRYRERAASRVTAVTDRDPSRKQRQRQKEKQKQDNGSSLASERVEADRGTWLAPFADVWLEVYGGTPPFGEMASAFSRKPSSARPSVRELPDGPERFRRYCRETEARFASAARFAQTAGSWGDDAKPAPTTGRDPDQNRRAAAEFIRRIEGER